MSRCMTLVFEACYIIPTQRFSISMFQNALCDLVAYMNSWDLPAYMGRPPTLGWLIRKYRILSLNAYFDITYVQRV
jgi:hypothetical protein